MKLNFFRRKNTFFIEKECLKHLLLLKILHYHLKIKHSLISPYISSSPSTHSITQEPYDTDKMSKNFIMQFAGMPLTVGQPLAYQFEEKKLLALVVKSLEAVDPAAVMSDKDKVELKKTVFGKLLGNTNVQFEKAENSSVNLTGNAKG